MATATMTLNPLLAILIPSTEETAIATRVKGGNKHSFLMQFLTLRSEIGTLASFSLNALCKKIE